MFFRALFLVILVITHTTYAATPLEKKQLAMATALYDRGAYNLAIEEVKKVNARDLIAAKHYLLGIAYSKLMQFDLASKHLKQAIKYGTKQPEVYYELGQALYASNELEEARKIFSTSYKFKYKPLSSLYYIAYISQLLEEYKKAKQGYLKLVHEKDINIELKQIARFQLAEVLTAINQKKNNKRSIVQKYILPQYKKALNIDKTSDLANDIRKRIAELKKQYRLDPNMMINGRTLPKKRTTIRLYQKMRYDDNVTLATDLPTTVGTNRDSFVTDSSLLLKYQLPLLNRFIIAPELRSNFTYYTDRTNSDIYQNDTISIAPALRFRLEHKLLHRPASLIFDIEHNVTERDREQKKEKIFFGRSTTMVLGEKFRFFSFGDTTFKLKFKTYTSYLNSYDFDATTLQLTQVMLRKNGHLAIFLFISDFTRMKEDSTNDTDSYLFRTDYIIPHIFLDYNLRLGCSITLLDTKALKDSRGVETTISPSIEISKDINKHVAYSLTWDYSDKSSDQESYAYSKQVLTFQFKLKY